MPLSKIDSDSLNSGAVTSAALGSALTFSGQQTIPTINLTGGQITFPATQVPSANANTLDDYEEGTWTPTFGSVSGTFTVIGTYVKIGRTVFVAATLSPTGTISGTRNSSTMSLPFNLAVQGVLGGSDNAIQNFGTGMLYSGTIAYLPTFSTNNATTFSGTYLVA